MSSVLPEVSQLRTPVTVARDPDCWAAYGRFLFSAVRTRCSSLIHDAEQGLLYYRRCYCGMDAATVYAFQESCSLSHPLWTTALRALTRIDSTSRVDHLNLYVSGSVPPEDASGNNLHLVADRRYLALALPYETRDILNLPPTFEEFLQGLGHSNRRHLKARHKEALEAGLVFSYSSDPAALGAEERFPLGLASRPTPYPADLIQAFDAVAIAKTNFWHTTLRTPQGELLSYACGFVEGDTAVMLYQFNHQAYPKLSLSMTLRAFLIKHWVGTGIVRILFPMGIGGHLTHAATTNPIAQVFFLRRAALPLAKALFMRLVVPTSDAALMVSTPGFWRAFFSR